MRREYAIMASLEYTETDHYQTSSLSGWTCYKHLGLHIAWEYSMLAQVQQ